MLQRGVRAQTHLLETQIQRSATYGRPAIEKLSTAGALSLGLSAAHGVWLTDEELNTLARSSVTLVHCPGSNTRLKAGTARVRAWLDAGVRVAFGIDSNATTDPPDVFVELRHAATVARAVGGCISPSELFEMATSGGATAVGLEPELGAVRPGARADLVSLLLPEPPRPRCDLLQHLVATATRKSVVTVWVDGRLVVRAGEHIDATAVAQARGRLKARLDDDAGPRETRMRALTGVDDWAQARLAALNQEVAQQKEGAVTHS